MKLEIITNAKAVELANFLLSEAIESALKNKKFKEIHNLKDKDLFKVETFRTQMLKAFFKHLPKTKTKQVIIKTPIK